MRSLLPFVISGLVTGSLYGLAGLGLALTYRTSGVFNFGHGAIAAGAAYVFYTLHVTYDLPWPVAVIVTMTAFATVVGFIMERIARGLGDVPEAVVVVVTVGILLGVQGLLFVVYGPILRPFPEFLPTSGFTVMGVNVSWSQVISFLVASGAAAALYLFLRRSRLGVSMRAMVDNPTLVALSGDRPGRVRAAAWVIGPAFAALSGILLAPTVGLDAILLTLLVVQAFGACAIGLFSNLPLIYGGGFVIGVVASIATKYLTSGPLSGVPSSVPFLILITVLLTVPAGKLPQRRASLGSLVPESPPLSRRAAVALVVGGGGALLAIPSVVGTRLPVWTTGLTYFVIFGSLALLVWTSGQISLCHASFVAIGATTMAHLSEAQVPWVPAVLLAGLLAVPAGALVVIPAIRVSGIYLALATLGFGILMQNVFYPTSWMFRSSLGVSAPRPQLGFIDGANDKWFYYIVLVFAALTCFTLVTINRGRLGRLLRALAESPTMLSTHGLGVNQIRLVVFCLSAFLAGVGGALRITQFGSATSLSYGPFQSLILLAVLAICGTRLLRSSILAAGLFVILPSYLPGFGVDQQTLAFGGFAIGAGLLFARRPDLKAAIANVAARDSDRLRHGPVSGRWAGRSSHRAAVAER